MKIYTAKKGNPKTSKNKAHSIILHMAPADLSGWNVCKFSSKGCRDSCLNRAGRGGDRGPRSKYDTASQDRAYPAIF